jgi:hypothetical protein
MPEPIIKTRLLAVYAQLHPVYGDAAGWAYEAIVAALEDALNALAQANDECGEDA